MTVPRPDVAHAVPPSASKALCCSNIWSTISGNSPDAKSGSAAWRLATPSYGDIILPTPSPYTALRADVQKSGGDHWTASAAATVCDSQETVNVLSVSGRFAGLRASGRRVDAGLWAGRVTASMPLCRSSDGNGQRSAAERARKSEHLWRGLGGAELRQRFAHPFEIRLAF
jgi:hypothetical protein